MPASARCHADPFGLVAINLSTSFDAGVPLRDVQEAASHADPRTTMRYTARVPAWTGMPPTSSPPTSPEQRDSPGSRSGRRRRWPDRPRTETSPIRSPDVTAGNEQEPPFYADIALMLIK
jgi:hypothetical protein